MELINCSTQTDLITESVSMETAIQVGSSVSSIIPSDDHQLYQTQTHSQTVYRTHSSSNRHSRRHSDTSLVASYQQMRKTLEKVHKLSQTICEPHKVKRDQVKNQKSLEQLSTRKLYQRDSAHNVQDSAQLWTNQLKNYQQQMKVLMQQVTTPTNL